MNHRRLGGLFGGLGLVLALLGADGARGAEAPREPREATLACSDGEPCRVSAYRGKPVVLFYEDRGSTEFNQALKDELFARGQAKGLLGAASVVAVANLAPYDFFPARSFALRSVRSLEKRFGIPILVDWNGTLVAPPWGLPDKTASVLILDEAGRVVWQRSGRLSADERAAVFDTLARLLGVSRELSATEPNP